MPHVGYNTSYRRAVEALQNATAPADLARRCGAKYLENSFELSFFGTSCTISLPECDFSLPKISLGEKILILHYLTSEGPIEDNPPPATFEGIGGMFYFETFKKRGPNRVLNDYGDDLLQLKKAAEVSGWAEGPTGDVSVVIPAFPLIDITVAAYLADDEFPPEVKFLFRRDITSFLSLEDTAALAGHVATRLMFIKHSLH